MNVFTKQMWSLIQNAIYNISYIRGLFPDDYFWDTFDWESGRNWLQFQIDDEMFYWLIVSNLRISKIFYFYQIHNYLYWIILLHR